MIRLIFLGLLLTLLGCGGPSDEELLRQFGGNNPASGIVASIDSNVVQEDMDIPNNPTDAYSFKVNMSIPISKRHDFRYLKDISDSNYKNCNVYIVFNAMSFTLYDIQVRDFTTSVTFDLNDSWSIEYNADNGSYIMLNTARNTTSEVPIKVYLTKDKSKIQKLAVGNRTYTNDTPIKTSVNKTTSSYGNANEYIVKNGDFANSIASNHNLTLRQFLDLNPRIKARKNYTVLPGEYVKVY